MRGENAAGGRVGWVVGGVGGAGRERRVQPRQGRFCGSVSSGCVAIFAAFAFRSYGIHAAQTACGNLRVLLWLPIISFVAFLCIPQNGSDLPQLKRLGPHLQRLWLYWLQESHCSHIGLG